MERMRTLIKPAAALFAGLLLGGSLLGACTSNGNGNEGLSGGGGDLPNDGTTPTDVTDGGTPITGNFICTRSASESGGVSTAVGTNGLVGGALTTLLNQLGGTTLTTLLNSVTEPDNVIDGDLDTFSTFSLTAGLLGGAIESVDESVLFDKAQGSGKYAVFGVTFPNSTVSLSLLNSVVVATYRNDVLQEANTLTQNELSLLNLGLLRDPAAAFIGLKTTKSFDRATIRLIPSVLSADVGDAMHVHELCTDGRFVNKP